MIARILAAASMASALDAQVPVIYDNGPFETAPGFSNLDTGLGLTAVGFDAEFNGTSNNTLYDDFSVGVNAPPTAVFFVEVYCFQTGSSATSTFNGAYVSFYDADPSTGASPMAGSPSPTQNNYLLSFFTNVHREVDGNGATDRPIMSVIAQLPAPLLLGPGRYWVGVQLSGDPSLAAPEIVPLTCDGMTATGNAMQFDAIQSVWQNPVTSGSHAQGFAFRLLGTGMPAAGVEQISTGCGGTGISVCGSTALGGYVRTELSLSNPVGIPVIGYGIGAPTPVPFCGCTVIHPFSIAIWFATSDNLQLPIFTGLVGLPITIQGAEVFGVGGCASPPITFTDGYRLRLGV